MKQICLCIAFLLLFVSHSFSQALLRGSLFDNSTGEPLVGARVFVPDPQNPIGTLSGVDGSFELQVDRALPITLVAELLGYVSEEIRIVDPEVSYELYLEKESAKGQHIMVSSLSGEQVIEAGSRKEEEKWRSPVAVYNLGVLDLYHAPSVDYFQQLGTLKEVHLNPSSMTLSAVNTRGFSDIQNWRFVQYLDGIEMNTPGLNYPLGNVWGGALIDMRNMEVVSGTASALYGANAFNGILSMNTKNPFEYKGFSAYATGGISKQEDIDAQYLWEAGARYATQLGDKWAFKVNFSTFQGHEWEARDRRYHLRPEALPLKDQLLALPEGHPNYDAIHTYGDEVSVPVDLEGSGNLVNINRTGFKEQDLIDYRVNNYKFNSAIHFRPKQGLEASYLYKQVHADAILRHTTVYPFLNTLSQLHKLNLEGTNFFVKAYYTLEDARDSYQMLTTGAFIQEALKPSSVWSADYGAAFRGEVTGVQAGNHALARAFADKDIPGPGTTFFDQALANTLNNPDISTGGSKFIDRSSLFHLEGGLRYDSLWKDLSLQVGGSIRNYRLNSEGNLFNDGNLGFKGPINYQDGGVYVQAQQPINDHLVLQAALRYDKNSNFQGRFSPRFSGVWNVDSEGKHNLRFSAQQGFRNPASQEGYIALDLSRLILLGGLRDNIENYATPLPDGGGMARGVDIISSLVTLSSFQAFLAGGQQDPTLLRVHPYEYLKQESISAFEVGYRGLWSNSFEVDLNLYHNRYKDFVQRINAFSTLVNRIFSVYTNIDQVITSVGGGLSLSWTSPEQIRISSTYNFASYDADEAKTENPNFLPGFNTAPNQVKIHVSNVYALDRWGYSANFRWSDSFVWESPFGQGTIPAYSTVDAAILYHIPQYQLRIKAGATNLFGNAYTPIYGGPDIGAQYFLTFIYDPY